MAQGHQGLMTDYPTWVPDAARHYLAHTEKGTSIRELARAADCHASTILRQVRRFEGKRDDPLVDDALKSLAIRHAAKTRKSREEAIKMKSVEAEPSETGDMDAEAFRVLRRLCEGGAVLAVAREMEMAVVVRNAQDGTTTRTAVAAREVAQAMALRDWITCADPAARIMRYHITATGRSALKQFIAGSENRLFIGSDPSAGFAGDDDQFKARYGLGETPLSGLARRRDRDGRPFLSRDLVSVGERLREDFELASMDKNTATDWSKWIASEPSAVQNSAGPRDRVIAALSDLGPGLGDVALRCCCLLEGLETAEKNMGWAARSGKIVLRIALQRLKRHYLEQGQFAPKIG